MVQQQLYATMPNTLSHGRRNRQTRMDSQRPSWCCVSFAGHASHGLQKRHYNRWTSACSHSHFCPADGVATQGQRFAGSTATSPWMMIPNCGSGIGRMLHFTALPSTFRFSKGGEAAHVPRVQPPALLPVHFRFRLAEFCHQIIVPTLHYSKPAKHGWQPAPQRPFMIRCYFVGIGSVAAFCVVGIC